MADFIADTLAELEEAGLKRTLRDVRRISPRESEIEGRAVVDFSSNDYLGLSMDSRVKAAAAEWLEKLGAGSGASRLISGNSPELSALEKRVAAWKGAEAALIIGSGFSANAGALAALADRHSVIFADKLNHASLNTGAMLSGAEFVRYPHNDMAKLASALERHASAKRKIIVSDTVFSMDGDIADCAALAELAEKHGAVLYLDDAHATGVFGDKGEGLAKVSAPSVRTVVMSTFSKAMGSYGACLTCPRDAAEYFVCKCPPLIYSTAMPPAVYGAVSAAVDIVQTPECRRAAARLLEMSEYLRAELKKAGFDCGKSVTQIIPVIAGTADSALRLSRKLMEKGFFCPAVRPPTVPENSARLRISLNSHHTERDIESLLAALRV